MFKINDFVVVNGFIGEVIGYDDNYENFLIEDKNKHRRVVKREEMKRL